MANAGDVRNENKAYPGMKRYSKESCVFVRVADTQ